MPEPDERDLPVEHADQEDESSRSPEPEHAPVVSGSAGVGVGKFPRALNRFNWGAFFLPVFWGVAYGVWPIVIVWLMALAASLFFTTFAAEGAERLQVIAAIAVGTEIVSGLARLWAGSNANLLLWRRDQLRLEVLSGSEPRFTVEKYEAKQRVWRIAGAIMLGLSAVTVGLLNAQQWATFGLTIVGPALPVIWIVAEVSLGIWLDSRMKTDQPLPAPAGR